MKRATSTRIAAFAIALSTLAGASAMAQQASQGKTRAQVQAELFEYQAAHKNDYRDPMTGLMLSQLESVFKEPSATGKTREQVKAELLEYRAAHKNDYRDPMTGLMLGDFFKELSSTAPG